MQEYGMDAVADVIGTNFEKEFANMFYISAGKGK